LQEFPPLSPDRLIITYQLGHFPYGNAGNRVVSKKTSSFDTTRGGKKTSLIPREIIAW